MLSKTVNVVDSAGGGKVVKSYTFQNVNLDMAFDRALAKVRKSKHCQEWTYYVLECNGYKRPLIDL